MPVKTRSGIEVLQEHTDSLGHLNHVQAVEYLERARDDWYKEGGLWEGRPWSDDENLATVVVNISVNYRLECFLGERLVIETFPVSRGTKSFTLGQKIIKQNGDIAIDGQATSVVMDMSSHGTIPVPACLARYLPPR